MQQLEMLQPELVPHHKIASLHRDMTEEEYKTLLLSIEENGQLVPVILFRGKLVDGRHRQQAILELGIHDMTCISLPHNTALKDVKNKVLGTEMRRTDSKSQKAIKAYKWIIEETGRTQSDGAIKFGVDQGEVSRAKKVSNLLSPKAYDAFYRIGLIQIGTKTHSQLITIIKALEVDVTEVQSKEPISNEVKEIMKAIQAVSNKEDLIGIAMLDTFTTKIRKGMK